MRMLSRTVMAVALLTGLAASIAATELNAQSGADAFFRAVAEYFAVSEREVSVITDWRLPAEEVTVVLFLAARSGVSPDVIAAIRGGGSAWNSVAAQYGLGAAVFHTPLGSGTAAGSLSRAYQEFSARPSTQWGDIRLTDSEIVGLVNVRFLSEFHGVSVARVIEAGDRSGGFVAAHRQLTPNARD